MSQTGGQPGGAHGQLRPAFANAAADDRGYGGAQAHHRHEDQRVEVEYQAGGRKLFGAQAADELDERS